ncbi:hypothetical protein EV368DRAFT_64276 [Lentinula lateritia]|nr:hypothetical protein EV368DRAFT_64276 [Lentinula lateritia]
MAISSLFNGSTVIDVPLWQKVLVVGGSLSFAIGIIKAASWVTIQLLLFVVKAHSSGATKEHELARRELIISNRERDLAQKASTIQIDAKVAAHRRLTRDFQHSALSYQQAAIDLELQR